MNLKRLYRRIRWLLVYQWYSLLLKKWPFETCLVCGKAFRVCWSVENEYWYKVMEVQDDGGGSLCLDCFLEKAEKKGIKVPTSAITISVFEGETT